jgi:hypothetical protein
VGKEKVFPPVYGDDQKEPAKQHEQADHGKGQREDKRKGGMNVLQPHDGNIPEKKNEKAEDQARKHQEPEKHPLFRSKIQRNPPVQTISSNVEIQMSNEPVTQEKGKCQNPKIKIQNHIAKFKS